MGTQYEYDPPLANERLAARDLIATWHSDGIDRRRGARASWASHPYTRYT